MENDFFTNDFLAFLYHLKEFGTLTERELQTIMKLYNGDKIVDFNFLSAEKKKLIIDAFFENKNRFMIYNGFKLR